MTDQENLLRVSFRYLNSLLIFVFLLFMIDVVYARSQYLGYFWIAILVAVPVKIYCSSGIYGYLTEIVSRQEMVLTFSRFHANAVRYLALYTGILAGVYGLHFIVYSAFPEFRVWCSFRNFYAAAGLLVTCLLAWQIIADKYLKPRQLSSRKILVSLPEGLVLICLFALEAVLTWLPVRPTDIAFDWARVITFALKYVYILQFIYVSLLFFRAYREIPEGFEKSHQIYLINPCSAGVIDGIAFQYQMSYPPFFVVLKALTPKTYGFREFNRIFWRERYFGDDKLVAITSFTSNCAEAYKIAKEFRRRGSKVVMGGPHVTYLPDEALQFCDSVVVGEAEGVWKQVIEDFEHGTLKPKYMGEAREDFYEEVHAELLRSPGAVVKDFLETTRGCKFRCHFCTIPSLSGGKTRRKPIEEIVELIKKIKHRYSSFLFIDNNIYSDPAYAKQLFEALIPLKIRWSTQCTIDIAKNTETLALAKKSGCDMFLFGYEIFGGSLEKQQGGKFAMAENYVRYTDIIKKMGIKVKAHFIFGFDSDRFRDLLGLWKFCVRIWPRWTIISLLTPLPGSRVYHDMLKENRIINLNWSKYANHDLVIRHPHMNPKLATFLFPFIRTGFIMTTSSGGLVFLGAVTMILVYEIVLKPHGFSLF